jgi:hypothetical protein
MQALTTKVWQWAWVSDEASFHLRSAHFEVVNPYGTLTFDVAGALAGSRRSLRQPRKDRS